MTKEKGKLKQEKAQWVRTLVTFAQDQGSAPTLTQKLTTLGNSSSRGFDTLSDLCMHCWDMVQIYIEKQNTQKFTYK